MGPGQNAQIEAEAIEADYGGKDNCFSGLKEILIIFNSAIRNFRASEREKPRRAS